MNFEYGKKYEVTDILSMMQKFTDGIMIFDLTHICVMVIKNFNDFELEKIIVNKMTHDKKDFYYLNGDLPEGYENLVVIADEKTECLEKYVRPLADIAIHKYEYVTITS